MSASVSAQSTAAPTLGTGGRAPTTNAALQSLPPPPPEDPVAPATAPATPATSAPTSPLAAPAQGAPNPPPVTAAALPPPPPGSDLGFGTGIPLANPTLQLAALANSERRAERRLRRLSAVLHDYGADDRQQANASGYTLMIGGVAMVVGALAVELLPGRLSASNRHATALTIGGLSLPFLVPAFLLIFRRTPYEQMAAQCDADVGSAQQRYGAVLGRWQSQIASERTAQRIGAISMIVAGALVGIGGVVQIGLSAAGTGSTLPLSASVPVAVMGGLLVPLGIFTMNLRPESERSLRAFQLAQGDVP